MGKLTYATVASLDGYNSEPGAQLELLDGAGFETASFTSTAA
jgi:hypothetical protein